MESYNKVSKEKLAKIVEEVLHKELPVGGRLTNSVKELTSNTTIGAMYNTGLTKVDYRNETDEEIDKRIRKEYEDLPDGIYKINDFVYTGKYGYIEFMIQIAKEVRDLHIK